MNTFENLPVMTEIEAKTVSLWQAYQDRKAPMIVMATPVDFVDFDLHRAFIVVPQDSHNFVMVDRATADDAKAWCSEHGLPVSEVC